MRHFQKTIFGVLLVIFILTCFTLVLDTSAGETITVAKDGAGDHETIQEAIDAAVDDDIIEIGSGIYRENPVIDKGVELKGIGIDDCVIDGSGNEDVVTVNADNVRISRLTVQNSSDDGVGIMVNWLGAILKDLKVTNNEIGIQIEGTNAKLDTVNSSDNSKTGVNILDQRGGTIENSTFNNNRYYGIAMANVSYYNIEGVMCNGNTYGIHVRESNNITTRKPSLREGN